MRSIPVAVALIVATTFAPRLVHAHALQGTSLHKDERYGYQIKAPREWGQIPIQADEDWLIAKWLSEKSYFWTEPEGGWTWEHKPELMVIAFVHDIVDPQAKEEEEKKKEEEGEDDGDEVEIRIREKPYKDYEDYLDRTYSGGGFYVSDREEKKHKGINTTRLEIKVEKLAMTGPKRIVTWIYHLEDVDIAVQVEMLEDAHAKLKRTISTTHKSFKIIPRSDQGLPGEARTNTWITITSMTKGTPEQRRQKRQQSEEQYREQILANLPDDWSAKQYKRVFVVSHAGDKWAKTCAEQAGAILDWCDDTFPFVGHEEYVRSPIIRICKDYEEYKSYSKGRMAGGGGFWFGGVGVEIVTYAHGYFRDDINREVFDLWWRDKDMDLYWAMPSWLRNGLNEYVENLWPKGRGVTFRPDWWAEDDLREVIREGRTTRPRDLMKMADSAFFEEGMWDRMREAGALVHFFLSGKASKNQRTKDVLQNYLRELKQVTEELEEKREEEAPEAFAEPETEEEEEEQYKKRRESWKDREQAVIDEVYYRTFGGWTDKDWDIFERAYFKSID